MDKEFAADLILKMLPSINESNGRYYMRELDALLNFVQRVLKETDNLKLNESESTKTTTDPVLTIE